MRCAVAMRAPAIWSTESAWSGSRPVDCIVTYGTSIESDASVSKTRTCGAMTTSPSMPCAARWARASAMDGASADSMFAVLTQYPDARAAASIAAMLEAGPYCVLDAERMPIVRDRLVTRARAARLGLYCRSAMTSSTRCFVSGRMLGWWFSTRDTVWCETPARRATSRMLGARPRCGSCVTGPRSLSRHVHGHTRRRSHYARQTEECDCHLCDGHIGCHARCEPKRPHARAGRRRSRYRADKRARTRSTRADDAEEGHGWPTSCETSRSPGESTPTSPTS